MENGYAITMGMILGAFGIFIHAAWPEIKNVYNTFIKEER